MRFENLKINITPSSAGRFQKKYMFWKEKVQGFPTHSFLLKTDLKKFKNMIQSDLVLFLLKKKTTTGPILRSLFKLTGLSGGTLSGGVNVLRPKKRIMLVSIILTIWRAVMPRSTDTRLCSGQTMLCKLRLSKLGKLACRESANSPAQTPVCADHCQLSWWLW